MTVFTLDPGWPAALLPAEPPSVEDRQTAPTAGELLPQIVALAPRGQAWGTDEAGLAVGCSPVMAQFWTAIALWVADLNARESAVAAQGFPSAILDALADFELELGLANIRTPLASTIAGRIATVRMRLQGVAGPSPADVIGLCAAVGAEVTIEEPEQFRIEASEVGPVAPDPADLAALDMVADVDAWRFWLLRVVELGPFATAAELDRALRPFAPQHVEMVLVP